MATSRRATTVGLVAFMTITGFEYMAVITVMPAIAAELDGLAWYAAAFGAAVATSIVGMVLGGRWCDRSGPAPALWTGAAAFVAGLCAAGLAPDMPQLVAARTLQGVGGGLMSVAFYVVVGRVYPKALHPRIFSMFAAAWIVPAIVGPALAGWLTEHISWRWNFLAGGILMVPAAWLLRQGLADLPPGPADSAGAAERGRAAGPALWAAVVVAASAGLLYAGGRAEGLGGAAMLLALLGVILLAPRVLPAGTLQARPGLPAVVALRGLSAGSFFAAEALISLLLIRERGLSPMQSGLVLTIGALGWSAGSWYQGRADRVHSVDSHVRAVRLGMVLMTAGVLGVLLVLLPGVPVVVAGLAWAVCGLGVGVVYPSLPALMLECVPGSEQGTASSALQLSDALLSAVALALASALLAAVQPRAGTVGYLAGCGLVAGLTLLGAALAGRARPR